MQDSTYKIVNLMLEKQKKISVRIDRNSIIVYNFSNRLAQAVIGTVVSPTQYKT